MKILFHKRLLVVLLLLSNFVFAQKTPPFWNDIQQFKKADSLQPLPWNSILFTGSSSIRLWKNLQEAFPSHSIINRGFGGSVIPDVIRYADDIIFPYHPKQIVIYCGDNDMVADTVTSEVVLRRFQELFTTIRNKMPGVPIAFISMKPSPSRWQLREKVMMGNEQIKKFLAKQKKTSFIDVWKAMLNEAGQPMDDIFKEDKLHMNEKGYAIWQRMIEPYLLK